MQKPKHHKLRWLIGLSSLPLFATIGAFAIAPMSESEPIETAMVSESLQLTLPESHPDTAETESYWREERVRAGDTLPALLGRMQVSDKDAETFIRNDESAKPFFKLRAGRNLSTHSAADGKLLELRYIDTDGNVISLQRDGDSFRVHNTEPQYSSVTVMKSGVISSSLFAATDKANLPDAVAAQMVEIFGASIDFHKDLQKGDRFTVVYDMMTQNGEQVKPGKILAAEFTNAGKTYRMVYFIDREGKAGYYSADGKNLKKAFLRSPLEFSRISSGFTIARFHPVLQKWRAHKGVDYAAPSGTKVKATADATVETIGKMGGYGNVIILKHNGKYSTLYGHLSGFAQGLRKGSKVSQGEVIGYVGQTGWATGPHLHYEFRVEGEPKDPLTNVVPVASQLAQTDAIAFKKLSAERSHMLDLLHGTNLAKFE
ncbi:murein DD-endopeptidase MepM/ murein hydrolase activator NlpD [Chitinivorax tropicus]|uniref:Murein DD-endopeptidase MepM/ murein hydrolase activator NlpD n=1 Tax=Chitinivorax tropicus TaxID=714531 RepID=A0A840MNT3_9PROT|nr:M23 family metallopeptidase [Chitinivorax tropicus]MBB5018667.1 murein DD-endopeptidase MepM/ murein hydrolase activator NlpD [Chitinivorax tropicus]